jgi:hypothetical protein
MTRLLHLATLVLLGALAQAAAAQGHAHEHGLVRLDVAIDGPLLSLQLEAPLDSLVGFEHRPRTPAQRAAADAAIERLKQGAALWRPDAAAQCRLAESRLQAEALQHSDTAPQAGHADLDALYVFRCAAPAQLNALQHGLFEAFPRIQRLQVQVAGPQGQFRQTLRRPATALRLAR